MVAFKFNYSLMYVRSFYNGKIYTIVLCKKFVHLCKNKRLALF